MKKFLASLIFVLTVAAAFADLYKPRRVFEIGVDANVSAGNNVFQPEDFLQKELVIDLEKIASRMKGDGLVFELQTQEDFFINLNVSSRFRFGIFAGVKGTGYFNLEQALFDFIADGISANGTRNMKVNFYTDVFADMGVSFQTLIKDFGVKIAPAYVVPVVFMAPTTAKAKLSNNSKTGVISLNASNAFEVYSAVGLDGFLEDDVEKDIDINKILGNGGIDLSFEVERNFLPGLNAGVYGRIPVVPGKLKHKTSMSITAEFATKNLLDTVFNHDEEDSKDGKDDKGGDDDDDSDYYTKNFDVGDKEYEVGNYSVTRPMKFGVEASYRPFGDWIFLYSKLGFAVRNVMTPFEKVFYAEYDFAATLALKRFMGITVGSAFEDRMFSQYFKFFMNLRLVEFNVGAALSGINFINSFKTTGASVYAGVRIGL